MVMNKNWIFLLILIVFSSFVSATWLSPNPPPPSNIVTFISGGNGTNGWINGSGFTLTNLTVLILNNTNITGWLNVSQLCINGDCITDWTELNSTGNNSFNQSLTDILYADIIWGYNQTLATLNITDGLYLTEESDPLWSDNSSTVARVGTCGAGEVVQNTTTGGVQCVTQTGGDDGESDGLGEWMYINIENSFVDPVNWNITQASGDIYTFVIKPGRLWIISGGEL